MVPMTLKRQSYMTQDMLINVWAEYACAHPDKDHSCATHLENGIRHKVTAAPNAELDTQQLSHHFGGRKLAI